MKVLTFEQLRINLTLTFDELEEPVEVVKRGKVQGYIIKALPSIETPVLRSCPTMPKVKKSSVKRLSEATLEPEPCDSHDMPAIRAETPEPCDTPEQAKPIIKTVDDVKRLVDSLPMRAYFRPCTKASQTHSAGKAKDKRQ